MKKETKEILKRSRTIIGDLSTEVAWGEGFRPGTEKEAADVAKAITALLNASDGEAEYTALLVEGRHAVTEPYNFAVFSEIDNVTDFEGMYKAADERIPANCGKLTLIVTGLSAALLAVVKVCTERGISLTALHFNVESGKYLPQEVLK